MAGRATLEELARLVGIETRYIDALGQSREASEDSLLAVIAALGLPAEPAQALAELEEVRHAAPLGLGSTSL
ncbi:MAG TPA: hypothetical protein VMF05_10305, partial [Stellaceae bacterium]|nr:hypothetical protein [Stellaceae bacterium]